MHSRLAAHSLKNPELTHTQDGQRTLAFCRDFFGPKNSLGLGNSFHHPQDHGHGYRWVGLQPDDLQQRPHSARESMARR